MELPELLALGGIKNVQTGWLFNPTLSTATGEDESYYDVPISAVDVNKAVPNFIGGASVIYSNGSYSVAANAMAKSFAFGTSPAVAVSFMATCRLINSTTLRISVMRNVGSGVTSVSLTGRWSVAEGK